MAIVLSLHFSPLVPRGLLQVARERNPGYLACTSRWAMTSSASSQFELIIRNPLNFIDRAQACGPIRDRPCLSNVELPAVLQVCGDTGCPKAVGAHFRLDSSTGRSSLNRHMHVCLRQGSSLGQLCPRRFRAGNSTPSRVLRGAGAH